MEEVPEENIREAEADRRRQGHDHEGVSSVDGTLALHLRRVHHLDVPAGMSPATQTGLHDRVHDETAAADD